MAAAPEAMPPHHGQGPARVQPDPMGLSETLAGLDSPPQPPAATILHNSLPVPQGSGSAGGGTAGAPTEPTGSSAIPSRVAASPRLHLKPRSVTGSMSDSGSMYAGSAHSSKGGGNLSSIFARRGSLLSTSVRKPKSVNSNRSRSSVGMSHDDAASSQSQSYEMQPVRGHGKKHVMQNHEMRVERRKAEAAVSKWRKWIVEQPASTTPAENPLFPLGFSRADTPLYSGAQTPAPTPAQTPPTSIKLNEFPGSARGSIAGLGDNQAQQQPLAGPSRDTGHPPGTPTSYRAVPAGQDIYNTESVRALRDVELAVDPDYFGHDTSDSPLSRGRRLSSHPRLSDMENPFAAIDTLLSRRGIRPLVLELVQALGAYIDAVWSITYPTVPCPWVGVPMSLAVRRTSIAANTPPLKTWRSWTITAVQEGKRRGLLTSTPTERDVLFWGWEIRYGLRDIDEAVNRRKDMGWAFGESVVQGQYGDITPANVMAGEGKGGNVARLLNDLEEALWGDAIPAATDLAFEHEDEFDPFSVYREGDELVGVEQKLPAARESDLREVFGDNFMSHLQLTAAPPVPVSPTPTSIPASSSATPSVRREPSYSPTATSLAAMPDLDMSTLGGLQEMSLEEKLELGRRRHQEYLQRTRGGSEGMPLHGVV